jgi:hypothetical protein
MKRLLVSIPLILLPFMSNMAFAQTAVPLNILWRVITGSSDRMTSVDPAERDGFPLEGQIFYVPKNSNTPGTTTVYRLFKWNIPDHMDSFTTNEGGYSLDGPIGYPWTSSSAVQGLSQLIRTFNPSNADHALRHPYETISGYIDEPMGVYGFRRFNNQAESLLSLTAGGVTIQSNQVAGGSLWRWTWNGVQFINIADYGREIQGSFQFYSGINYAIASEAGDKYYGAPAYKLHGSPTSVLSNNGSTQSTRSVPLEWNADSFGGDQDHPVVWRNLLIGKDITLNFNGMGSVAKYTSLLTLPQTMTTGILGLPSIFLRANFDRFYSYDAPSDILTERTSEIPDGCAPGNPGYTFDNSKHPPFTHGGLIITDSTGANAFGLYGVHWSLGGSASYLSMLKFFCSHDGELETSYDTTALNAVRGRLDIAAGTDNYFPAGSTTYNAYLISDSLANVRSKMHQLYLSYIK